MRKQEQLKRTNVRPASCPLDGVAEHKNQFFVMKKQKKIRKVVVYIIIAIIVTGISLVNYEAGLLISLVLAVIPFFKESATQQERADCCKDLIFTIMIAMVPSLLIGFLLQMVWILRPKKDE